MRASRLGSFLNTWKATFVPAIICFRVFGTTALESGWLHFLLTEVFAILAGLDPSSEKPPDASKKIYILGRPACLKGSSKLLGIGSGRVGRLRKGLMGDNPVCPLDARLRKAGRALAHPPKQTVKRQLIHEFLMELYIRHSEPMPEVAADHGGRAQTSKPLKFRRLKGKRPRKFTKRWCEIDWNPSPGPPVAASWSLYRLAAAVSCEAWNLQG